MRILLDESVPGRLSPLLAGHTVSTVQRQGWASIKNGELLALAAREFDVLLSSALGPPPKPTRVGTLRRMVPVDTITDACHLRSSQAR